MSRNIRDRRSPNTRVVHITNRCWHGLPFVPNRMMRRTIEAVVGKAQAMYQIELTCFLFMGNHYHMIINGCANRVSAFGNYVDGEISKRMVRFLPGHWGPQFWVGRFKEELLPNVDSVISKIAYIFCNPLKARLVSNLQSYTGPSSIKALEAVDYKTMKLCSFTFPRFFKPLKSGYVSRKKDLELCKELHRNYEEFVELKTDLFGWERCFKEKRLREEVLSRIRNVIAEAEALARSLGVIGANRLSCQPLDKYYVAKKKRSDRTPYVDCPDNDIRLQCIAEYQYLKAQCRTAWELVKQGIEAIWPHGAFVPSRRWIPLASPLTG